MLGNLVDGKLYGIRAQRSPRKKNSSLGIYGTGLGCMSLSRRDSCAKSLPLMVDMLASGHIEYGGLRGNIEARAFQDEL